MSRILPANRVVLVLHSAFVVATAAVVFVSALSGSLPHAWQPAAAFAVTILGGLAAATASTVKFLDGSQKSEALQAAVAEPEQLDSQEWLKARQPDPQPSPVPSTPASTATPIQPPQPGATQ